MSEPLPNAESDAGRRRTEAEARRCSQEGCPGDGRYQPPGRGHLPDCQHDAVMWVWETVTPPTTRPYCLRCEVPIYQDDDGVWRREATGSQACPRNPAVDGHEPAPTRALPSEVTASTNMAVEMADKLPEI